MFGSCVLRFESWAGVWIRGWKPQESWPQGVAWFGPDTKADRNKCTCKCKGRSGNEGTQGEGETLEIGEKRPINQYAPSGERRCSTSWDMEWEVSDGGVFGDGQGDESFTLSACG